jgi:hypothetical protein
MGAMPLASLVSYLLVHHAMHGSAIAFALDAPWPFDPGNLELMWPFIEHVVTRVVAWESASGVTACFDLHFGDELSFAMMFDHGNLSVARVPTRPVDCTVSGDAQTLFLVLIKLLRMDEAVEAGELILTGPKPELGFGLPDLINMP